MKMDAYDSGASYLSSWWRRRKVESSGADARVAAWKAAWREGAAAAWTSTAPTGNPYTAEPERTAWAAGHRWAQNNPDRRGQAADRLAHPQRRATDSGVAIIFKRAATVGAAGMAAYVLSTGVRRWRRGRKAKAEPPAHPES